MTAIEVDIRRAGSVAILLCALVFGAPVPAARALPDGFPDLDGFVAAPSADYFRDLGRSGPQLQFITPFNVECDISAGPPAPGAQAQPTQCIGDAPGVASLPVSTRIGTGEPQSTDCVVGQAKSPDDGSGPAYVLDRYSFGCPGQGDHPPYTPIFHAKVLQAGQKVTSNHVTCAVGADRLLACLDSTSGEHGFVLRPSGSVAF
jgi:hypothetical protein